MSHQIEEKKMSSEEHKQRP